MYQYFIAYNSKHHDTTEPLGKWAECIGSFSSLSFAKTYSSQHSQRGYKNVTIFGYNGDPYDKLLRNHVKWDIVLQNKIDL